ncbi:Uncharacterized protein AArcCO_2363 [Halalkaliarchaeum sp. AArc-CO]|uniref:DUF5790 family protein n=1 Tax=unclassified Halalkaliarchaeum TaxID=2678344 RepID=UPI00217F08FD|nr:MULTISPECIES: DUF5790 family protein [unclassified Halalkaliarchaeum]MDR5672149.1 DUF5790 family protein [Halalkaliarchaeum sp. AArc-GB]UWG51654.1 Uncharacterized protein AArcCO_2363 [Halalkaliarchaeum sp. AArc-CO]
MSSQTTFGDDELFGEAADEMREDVESHLETARAELPSPEDVWETDADNVLGALNGLKSALDVGDAAEELRQAKKWYTMGERADAFEDADDLEADLEELSALLETIEAAREDVTALTSTVPELRGALQEAADEDDDATDD